MKNMTTETKTQETILVPRKVEGREFYNSSISEALRNCQAQGYEAQFMPSVIDTRILADKQARIWQVWWGTPSVRATGRTRQGNAVVVYAHIPNYFSNPENIETAIRKGLRNGAGVMPQSEFQRLLDLEDNENVFVVDYKELRDSTSNAIYLKDALKHPQTIPFVGGEKRAENYLERHKEVYGNKIGIWHSDDLADEPRGRVLFVGVSYNNGLYGNDSLDSIARFVGVCESAEGALQKISPTKQQIEKIINEFVVKKQERVRLKKTM